MRCAADAWSKISASIVLVGAGAHTGSAWPDVAVVAVGHVGHNNRAIHCLDNFGGDSHLERASRCGDLQCAPNPRADFMYDPRVLWFVRTLCASGRTLFGCSVSQTCALAPRWSICMRTAMRDAESTWPPEHHLNFAPRRYGERPQPGVH